MAVTQFFDKLCKCISRRHSGQWATKNLERRSAQVLYGGALFWGLLVTWVMFNLLASQFSAKVNIDLSDDKLYSLSKSSQNILQNLRQEIRIYALFSGGRRPTRPLNIYRYLELYAASSPYLVVAEIDPELAPEKIRPFITGGQKRGRGVNKAPQRNSLIVWRPGGRFRVLHYRDLYYVLERFGSKNAGIRAEQQISSAIVYVNGAKMAQLGLLSGHREQNLTAIKPNFEQFNIAVQKVALRPETAPLSKIDVLLIYKPQLDLRAWEYRQLRSYLGREASGKALWLVLDFQAEFLPNFYQLAKDYGIEILEGLVLERDPKRIQAASGYTTFVTPLASAAKTGAREVAHPIVQLLRDNESSDLLWVQSMAVRQSQPHPRRMRFYKMVESSRMSLLRSSRDPSSKTTLTEDHSGPLTLMGLSVWQNEQGQRSGPALLVSFDMPGQKSVFNTPGNLQLFYSALAWLGSSSESTANIETLVFPSKSLLMLPMRLSQSQAIWWAAIFVLLLPLALLLLALLFLLRRQHL